MPDPITRLKAALVGRYRIERGLAVTFPSLTLTLASERAAIAQDQVAYRVLFLGNSLFFDGSDIHRPFEGFAAAGMECQAVTQHDGVG